MAENSLQKLIKAFQDKSQYGAPESTQPKLDLPFQDEAPAMGISPDNLPVRPQPEAPAPVESTPMEMREPTSEADQLVKTLEEAKPESVKAKVKEQVAQKKAEAPKEDPLAKLQKDMEEFQKLSAKEKKSAKEADRWTKLSNSLQDAISLFAQARAAKNSGRMMDRIESPFKQEADSLKQAMAESKSSYEKLRDRLMDARAEQDKATKLSEAEKDRDLKREIANMKSKEQSVKLSPGQEALDKAFAKQYSEDIASGASQNIKGNIQSLEDIKKDIQDNKDMFTGILDTAVESLGGSDLIRSALNPKLQSVKDRLEKVIQQDLRKTLGAQFTEKEAERLMERSFNPKLSAQENIDRIQGVIDTVKGRQQEQERAAKYFEKKGTLQGFESQSVGKTGEKTELAPNEVVRTTSDGRRIVYDATTKKPLRELK